MAQHFSTREDASSIIALLEALPDANPVIASGVLMGIAGGPTDDEGRQRGGPDGWPEGSAPALTAEQRATLVGLAARVAPDVAEGLERVAARWEIPDLFGSR